MPGWLGQDAGTARQLQRRIGRQPWWDKGPHWFSSDRRRDVGPQPRLVFSDHSRYEGSFNKLRAIKGYGVMS